MKTYLSDIAQEKYNSLDNIEKNSFDAFIKKVATNENIDYSYDENSKIKISKLNDNFHVFFSNTKIKNEEIAIILDLISIEKRQNLKNKINIITSSDPNRNSTINPNRNSTINPTRNSTINPNRNPTINPSRNPTINPNRNPSINPSRNPSVNYLRNPSINPNRNPSINPNRNPSINIYRNRSYKGPFRYDNDLELIGICVKVNDKIMLQFSVNLDFEKYAINVDDRVHVVFNTKNEWVEYIVAVNNVFIIYSISNQWQGIIV